jgi:hypothetical protein
MRNVGQREKRVESGRREGNEPVNDSLLLVQVADSLGDLSDDVTGQLLGKVGELDDLVEELSSLHKPAKRERNMTSGVLLEDDGERASKLTLG